MSMTSTLDAHELQVEQTLVGVVTTTTWGPHLLTQLVEPQLFGDQRHRVLWDTMRNMLVQGKAHSRDALLQELQNLGLLSVAGGAEYVRDLPALCSFENARTLTEQVMARGVLRLVQEEGRRLAGQKKAATVREVLDEAFTSLSQLQQQIIVEPSIDYDDALTQALASMQYASTRNGGLVGYSTGLRSVDDLLGGLQGGKFIIIGARPSIGKSVVAAQFAQGAAAQLRAEGSRKKVLIVSLEMNAAEFATRDISRATHVSSEDLARGFLPQGYNREAFDKVVRQGLAGTPIVFEDKLTKLTDIVSRIRRMHANGELGAVFIDYLQLVKAKAASREQEISAISRTCKQLARELQIPVVGLSQLSREAEKRNVTHKRPMISDLRESGSLEQDADQIVLLYRPEFYKDKDGAGNYIKGVFEFDVAKNRGGSLDTVKAHCDMRCLLIWDNFSGSSSGERPAPQVIVKPVQAQIFQTEAYVVPGRQISAASLGANAKFPT